MQKHGFNEALGNSYVEAMNVKVYVVRVVLNKLRKIKMPKGCDKYPNSKDAHIVIKKLSMKRKSMTSHFIMRYQMKISHNYFFCV